MPKLDDLNAIEREEFTRLVGPVFENSPWIAQRASMRRPFKSVDDLHQGLCGVVNAATETEKLSLVCAHPDLAERLALTPESRREQEKAGLRERTPAEEVQFRKWNREYRERFGFPFVICARMNNRQTMLDAFAARLQNAPDQELETALAEIFKIAKLRLEDLIG